MPGAPGYKRKSKFEFMVGNINQKLHFWQLIFLNVQKLDKFMMKFCKQLDLYVQVKFVS